VVGTIIAAPWLRMALCGAGNNGAGRIGGGGGGANAVSPTAVLGADGTPVRTAKSVHCGQGHTCAVLGDDTVWCWGRNGDGQLGVGDNTTTNALTVPVANLENVQSLSVGIAHNCALLKNATLRCWGENSHGSLGVGDITNRATPVTVTAGIGDARSVSCGYMTPAPLVLTTTSFGAGGETINTSSG
jgi:alpha-tubulin suppressor-like RCC1 family protein